MTQEEAFKHKNAKNKNHYLFLTFLGSSWAVVGPSWGRPGAVLGCLGAILEPSWAVLRRLERYVGSVWSLLLHATGLRKGTKTK